MSSGLVTSGAEVVQLTPHGLWLLVDGRKYFLKHRDFPWFEKAPVGAVWKVETDRMGNLHWPELDVDLEMDSLESLDSYPLIYR